MKSCQYEREIERTDWITFGYTLNPSIGCLHLRLLNTLHQGRDPGRNREKEDHDTQTDERTGDVFEHYL